MAEIFQPCIDCGGSTSSDFYRVRDEVWAEVGLSQGTTNTFCCVGCLEKRLGRKLNKTDFEQIPMNYDPDMMRRKNPVLQERLNRPPDGVTVSWYHNALQKEAQEERSFFQRRLEQRQSGNPLDGKTKEQAANFVNKLISPLTRGVFSDNSWVPIHKIWKALEDNKFDWNTTTNQYLQNDRGENVGKEWKFEIRFDNNKHNQQVLYGVVHASFCGSVADPSERYDVVAYAS